MAENRGPTILMLWVLNPFPAAETSWVRPDLPCTPPRLRGGQPDLRVIPNCTRGFQTRSVSCAQPCFLIASTWARSLSGAGSIWPASQNELSGWLSGMPYWPFQPPPRLRSRLIWSKARIQVGERVEKAYIAYTLALSTISAKRAGR